MQILKDSKTLYLQVDSILVGELDSSRILGVDKMIIFGNQTHEVWDLPDDNAVGAGETAGRRQVAAGVAGLQSCRRCSGTWADCTWAPQVSGVNIYQACGACCGGGGRGMLVLRHLKFSIKTAEAGGHLLTGWCWGAGGSASRCSLAGGVSHSPLHGARSLSCTVSMWRISCPFQRLIQQKRLLVNIVTLAAAAVWVTGVIGLRVILWKEGRDTAGTFKVGMKKKIKKTSLMFSYSIWPTSLSLSHQTYPSGSAG